jgi:excisionase family DNA binding protein
VDSKLAYRPDEIPGVFPIGRTKVFALIKSGELESIKVGRARLVPAEAIKRLMARLHTEQNGGEAA